jgi:hypothetical protein
MSKNEQSLESANAEELSQEALDQVTGGWSDMFGDGISKRRTEEDVTSVKTTGDLPSLKSGGPQLER